MKIYFAWSGDRSLEIATALGNWISQVIQAVEPWISKEMDKGARWQEEIGSHLEEVKVGIVCLTPENLLSPWINFEAGAISKMKDSYVCTFLLNLAPNDVHQPLSQFQHTRSEKEDIRRLLQTVNKLVGTFKEKALNERNFEEVFDTFWPRLEEQLKVISARTATPPAREQKEILDEILTVVRGIAQRSEVVPSLFDSRVSLGETIPTVAYGAGYSGYAFPAGATIVVTTPSSGQEEPQPERTISPSRIKIKPPLKKK